MATAGTKLYDRKTIVDVIQRDCLGHPGSSTVVIGAQKVGKTCLLGHVWSLGIRRKETIFCQVDIYSLEAAGFSDDSFLRLFLADLQDAVARVIEQMEPSDANWQSELGKPDAERSGFAEVLRASMQELSGLRQVEKLIQGLLDRKDLLAPSDTFVAFNGLRRINKRVMLVIDEFHRMLREPGFSNRLFAFLRGASTQGKILTLVSSPVHLMDPSLHGPNADVSFDRLNLFNHYQVQFLEPFSQVEAEGFLDWFEATEPGLSSEEKAYLHQLGGGSPHFLKFARSLFLESGRPQTEETRRDFEARHVEPRFEGDFRLLWGRCSLEERTVMSELAAGRATDSPLVAKLEREGYLTKRPAGTVAFSALFAKFVRDQRNTVSKSKERSSSTSSTRSITVMNFSLVSETFVTALGLARPEDAEIFTFDITNSGTTAVRVLVACRIGDYSQNTVREYAIEPGTTKLYGYAFLRPVALKKLDNAVPTNVHYRISLVNPVEALAEGQLGIRLLPPNNFLMAVLDPTSNQLKNYTWLIAAWVRRRGNKLQEVLNSAGTQHELHGYQIGPGQDVVADVREQVRALYNAVKEWGIQYQNNVQVYLNDPAHYLQQVRFPEESLTQHAANCLDMAVLFASLLSSCQISPLVLLVPGHALVGWKDGAGGCEFIQTTSIGANSFDEARSIGMQYFELRKEQCEASLKVWAEAIENPSDFSILIDVDQVSRTRRLIKV
jgi:hypothetical protein